MKCSGKKKDGSHCTYESDQHFHFCPECGSGCPEDPLTAKIFIKCPGKKGPCGTDLASDSDANFCNKCGWEIDKSLFVTPKTCPGNLKGAPCGAEVIEGINFCSKCGFEFLLEDTAEGQETEQTRLDTNAPCQDANDNAKTTNVKEDDVKKKHKKKKKKKKSRGKTRTHKKANTEFENSDSTDESDEGTTDSENLPRMLDSSNASTMEESSPLLNKGMETGPIQTDPLAIPLPEHENEGPRDHLQNKTTADGQATKTNNLSTNQDGQAIQQRMEGGNLPSGAAGKSCVGDSQSFPPGDTTSQMTPPPREQTNPGVTTRQMARAKEDSNHGNPDGNKMSYSDATKQKGKADQGGKENTRLGQGEPKVDVVFHVLVSGEMNKQLDADTVTIRFGSDPLGGWQSDKWKMTHARTHQDDINEYTCCIPMTKGQRNGGFIYKYVVQGRSKKDGSPFEYWETVHYLKRLHLAKMDPNRAFNYPTLKKKDLSPWHQYDGFVYPKMSEVFWKRWLSKAIGGGLQDRIRQDVVLAGELFLPSAGGIISQLRQIKPGESSFVETYLDTISMVLSGLSIQMVDKDMKLLDRGLPMQMFQNIMESLIHHLQKIKETLDVSLVLGMFILCAYSENNIPIRPEGLNKTFFSTLMVRSDKQSLESLKTHFPKRFSQILAATVLKLIGENSSVRSIQCATYAVYTYSKSLADSSWLYFVSLLHFLREDSKHERKYSIEHTNDLWWGLKDITDAKNRLKLSDDWTV